MAPSLALSREARSTLHLLVASCSPGSGGSRRSTGCREVWLSSLDWGGRSSLASRWPGDRGMERSWGEGRAREEAREVREGWGSRVRRGEERLVCRERRRRRGGAGPRQWRARWENLGRGGEGRDHNHLGF